MQQLPRPGALFGKGPQKAHRSPLTTLERRAAKDGVRKEACGKKERQTQFSWISSSKSKQRILLALILQSYVLLSGSVAAEKGSKML